MCGNYILSGPTGPTAKPDEWFTLDLIATGWEFTVKVNGAVVNRYTDRPSRLHSSRKGFLSLHAFMKRSQIEFRKLAIKELPAAAADAKK